MSSSLDPDFFTAAGFGDDTTFRGYPEPRYCKCGHRLASLNPNEQCFACKRAELIAEANKVNVPPKDRYKKIYYHRVES